MNELKTIVFACGGTLGHIIPAISMCREIKNKDHQIRTIFIMTNKEKQYEFINQNKDIDKIYYFDVRGLDRKRPLHNIVNFLKNIGYLKQIKKTLKREKVTLSIGMGGYISAICLKGAKDLKIKTIIHEQNSVMGLANKMCVGFVDLILSAFPLNIKNCKTKVIGNPRMIEAYHKQKNIDTNNHLVVTSGTLGSEKINNIMVEFLQNEKSQMYYTTLITGRKYYEEVVKKLGGCEKKHYLVKPFDDNLLDLLASANLIISRAGATTIFEIIGLNVPAIIIPSPNVTNNHQYYNALFLSKREAAILLEEKDLTFNCLIDKINLCINNIILRDNLKTIMKEYQNISWLEEIDNVR